MTTSSAGETPHVLITRKDRVETLMLNRPESRNALSGPLLDELIAGIQRAADDRDVGAIVLTGSGTSFCAGGNLKESSRNMEQADFISRYERANKSLSVHRMLPKLPKPVIAAVNGFAVAGGCGLAMSCDLVIASDQAQFGFPEVARGLVPAMVMVSLSRLVGRRQALDLLMSGRRIGASEALSLGLINSVVPHADLTSEAHAYAEQITANSATALRFTKSLFNQVCELDYDRALDWARDINQMIRQTDDARSGAAAFANRNQAKAAQ